MSTVDAKQTDEEFKIWKKNTALLYDLVMQHALEWPSLTVQWLPEKVNVKGANYALQKLLLGTHTADGETNFLHIAEVRIPSDNFEVPQDSWCEAGPDGVAVNKLLNNVALPEEESNYQSVFGKLEIVQSIVHNGEVNRARYCPLHPNLIATKAPSNEVYVFDRNKHPAKATKTTNFTPDFILKGHEKEGYGLAWNHKLPILLSGSDDSLVCLWDLSGHLPSSSSSSSSSVSGSTSSTFTSLPATHVGSSVTLTPTTIYRGHSDIVEDVAWHYSREWLFGSCGDDKLVLLWDTRIKETKPTNKLEGHSAEVNCLAFHPKNEHLFVSGSADRTVALWDLRNLSQKLHSFESHTEQITQVEWAPFDESILASASSDRRVYVWDMSKIGEEQAPEDAEDGPPELLFVHGGHTDKVVDFSWSPNTDWLIASTAEDNTLQIWTPAENIVMDEEEDENITGAKKVADEDLE